MALTLNPVGLFARVVIATIVAALTISAFAYVPKKDIKADRDGLTKFKFTGTNTRGKLDVAVVDQHLFQGFNGTGTNGDAKVEFEIRSAGLLDGWKIEGKIGDERIELKCKKKSTFSKEWEVTGKVGTREIKETVSSEIDIDPAVQAALIAFDA